MFLVSSCSCLCPIHWSQVLSQELKCIWSSADRRCSNYIWVINNFIAYQCVLILEVWQYIYISWSRIHHWWSSRHLGKTVEQSIFCDWDWLTLCSLITHTHTTDNQAAIWIRIWSSLHFGLGLSDSMLHDHTYTTDSPSATWVRLWSSLHFGPRLIDLLSTALWQITDRNKSGRGHDDIWWVWGSGLMWGISGNYWVIA